MNISRIDQKLRNAKNDKLTVRFALDCDTYFTDEDCTVEGKIEEVDKFDVAITITPGSVLHDKIVWIKKSHIVGTEVLV